MTLLSALANIGKLGLAGIATTILGTSITLPSNTSVTGTLGVTGDTSLANATVSGTLGVTGTSTLGVTNITGAVGVVGDTTITGALTVTGQISAPHNPAEALYLYNNFG